MELDSSVAAIASHHCAVQAHWSVCFIPFACMGLGDAICPAVGHTDGQSFTIDCDLPFSQFWL